MADFVTRHELQIVNGRLAFHVTNSENYDSSWLDDYRVIVYAEETNEFPSIRVILYQLHELKENVRPTMLRLANKESTRLMLEFSKIRQLIKHESESMT